MHTQDSGNLGLPLPFVVNQIECSIERSFIFKVFLGIHVNRVDFQNLKNVLPNAQGLVVIGDHYTKKLDHSRDEGVIWRWRCALTFIPSHEMSPSVLDRCGPRRHGDATGDSVSDPVIQAPVPFTLQGRTGRAACSSSVWR